MLGFYLENRYFATYLKLPHIKGEKMTRKKARNLQQVV